MKTLHLYLLRQVIANLAMTVLVFTFVLLLGNLLREILALLVNRQATLSLVLKALALLVPFVMVYALPMGLLTATLLVFGRFSADQELTAARAGGLSLIALSGPVLLLSLALAGLSGWFNLQLAPECRVAYKNLLYQLGVQQATGPLAENRLIKEFPGYLIFVGSAQSNLLKNVVIYQMDTNPPPLAAAHATNITPETPVAGPTPAKPALVLTAPEATVTLDPVSQQVRLFFPEVEGVYLDSWQPGGGRDQILELPTRVRTTERRDLKLTEMTFAQLLREYYECQRLGIDITPVSVQLHRQAAFSFACIGFALVGIPLGVRAHRRETSAGIALALVLVVFYYGFVILGQAWETRPDRWPQAILWLPNLLFQAVGAILLYRADR
jgi:lipopolysaccharide export system permease protein